MNIRRSAAMALVLCVTSAAWGQVPTYQPLGLGVNPATQPLTDLSGKLQDRTVRPETRPQIAGLRPRSVELLEDALLRKHSTKLRGDPARARQSIIRLYQKPIFGRNVLHGAMAEAMFLDRNKEWGYVGKPNAPQHDVYRFINGRNTPVNGQVKFHGSGKPSLYARSMRRDSLAHRFFIPDDHVEPTKAYLKAEAARLEARGNVLDAKKLQRDYNRLRPIGATSEEILASAKEANRNLVRERYATYTSLGATLAMSFGPAIYDVARGETSASLALYRSAHALSVMGVGAGANVVMKRLGKEALRGTARGNAIVGTAIAITETAWLLHEHGWGQALEQPQFYERMGGSISSLTIGLIAGGYATALAAETGPLAPVIGLGTGVVVGTITYVGGKSVTMLMIQVFSPEMLRKEERRRIEATRLALDENIKRLESFTAQ